MYLTENMPSLFGAMNSCFADLQSLVKSTQFPQSARQIGTIGFGSNREQTKAVV